MNRTAECRIPANKTVHVAATRSRAEVGQFSLAYKDNTTGGKWNEFLGSASVGQGVWTKDLTSQPSRNADWDFQVEVIRIQGGSALDHVSVSQGAAGDDQQQFFIYDNADVNTTVIVSYSDHYLTTYPWNGP